MFTGAFIGGSIFGVMFLNAYKDAQVLVENLDDKMLALASESNPSVIYSSDGKKLYVVQGVYRKVLGDYSKIPPNMRYAILAAEDRRFFDHSGIDWWSMLRVLFTAAREGRASQGGSTLTMQLAKRMYSNSERTFKRKIQDMALAVAMERKLSKEQILTLYLDQVYFGSGAWGVQAASDVYFGKPVDKLTLGECAMLARCVQSPSRENPYRNLAKAVENRNLVLGIMRDESWITADQYAKAVAETPKLRSKQRPTMNVDLRDCPYFVRHVLDDLDAKGIDFDALKQGGYKIYTTVDTDMQNVAEEQVRRIVRRYRGDGVTQGAFVLMDKDGQIKAEVGGVSYEKNQFNIVTQGRRQPGSSFKPFVYATAFANHQVSIWDSLPNQRHAFELGGGRRNTWTPKNSNGKYSDSISVISAFKWSVNVPAVWAMSRVGPDAVIQYANGAFGFSSKFRPVMSLALGAAEVSPLDMAQAYSVFMLRGNRATPYTITKIVGPDGETIEDAKPNIVPNVIGEEVTDEIDALMRAVVVSGTGREAGEVPNARGKTGTTSDNKDAWFCGYSDGLVGIGWIGNERIVNGRAVYRSMDSSVFGGTVTVQMWTNIMARAHERFATPMGDRPLADQVASGRGGGDDGLGTGPVQDPTGDPYPGIPSPDPTSAPEHVPNDGPGPGHDPSPDEDPIIPATDPSPPPTATTGGLHARIQHIRVGRP